MGRERPSWRNGGRRRLVGRGVEQVVVFQRPAGEQGDVLRVPAGVKRPKSEEIEEDGPGLNQGIQIRRLRHDPIPAPDSAMDPGLG
jgi:hypothetical protein